MHIVYFLFFILTATTSSQSNLLSKHLTLPNEYPDYMGVLKNKETNKSSFIYRLRNIIGALSYPEQMALYNSIELKDGIESLNEDTFIEQVTKNEIYKKEIISIISYISDFENQLIKGLGCITAVSNKYVTENPQNQQYQKQIYNIIEEIFTKHKEMRTNQINFMKQLQTFLFKRRKLILKATEHNSDIQTFTNDDNDITGFKYDENALDLYTYFTNYAEKQKEFVVFLYEKSIQLIISISNMDGCKNYNEPNLNAGESSNKLETPEITYSNRQQTSINNGNKIRDDQKTNNGYFLNHGFHLGEAKLNNYTTLLTESEISRIEKIQSCFGSFISGGRNDKDACRDVLTNQCSIDLDYKCKKSGFYDYILAHPYINNPIPVSCQTDTAKTEGKCMQWINKYFISSTITLKPSGFLSFGLNIQRNEDDIVGIFDLSKAQAEVPPPSEKQPDATDKFEIMVKDALVVFEEKNIIDDINDKYLLMDKQNYELIEGMSFRLKVWKSLIIIGGILIM